MGPNLPKSFCRPGETALGSQSPHDWVAVEDLELSYHSSKTTLSTIYPYYTASHMKPREVSGSPFLLSLSLQYVLLGCQAGINAKSGSQSLCREQRLNRILSLTTAQDRFSRSTGVKVTGATVNIAGNPQKEMDLT